MSVENPGDLQKMTVSELRDLLRRQEKLYSNKLFIHKLPDKGAKIAVHIKRIEEAIRDLELVDDTATQFEKMVISSDQKRQTKPDAGQQADLLEEIINVPVQDKVIVDKRVQEVEDATPNETSSAQSPLQKPTKVKGPKFLPNRSVFAKGVQDLNPSTLQDISNAAAPERTKVTNAIHMPGGSQETGPGRLPPVINEPGRRLKYHYDDSLEADIRHRKGVHESTKIIPLDEAIELLREQKEKQEENKRKQATERLAERFNIKLHAFDPEGSRLMAYRVQGDDDTDSDDD